VTQLSLLDKFIPVYDYHEEHSQSIKATSEKVYRVIKEITPSEIRSLSAIPSVPLLPRRIANPELFKGSRPLFQQALSSGFTLLAENPNEEFVMGRIAQFWKLRCPASLEITNAQQFRDLNPPEYAKAAINFRVQESGLGSRLSTETRVHATDRKARRNFGVYWAIIHPGSSLVRRIWLNAIKKHAEGV
jgi:hypothetical protein